MSDNKNDMNFSINFAPKQILQDAEKSLHDSFKSTMRRQIEMFLSSGKEYPNGYNKPPVIIKGAGLLMIEDFLEKKFDDPKTFEQMEKFYNDNFESIMGEAMAKALQHRANAFAFHKAKDIVIEPKAAA